MAIRLKDKKKVALALSGGGVKAAAFHIGVCLALREKGFLFAGGTPNEVQRNFPDDQHHRTIRLYVGSSAGSFVSAILSAGYSLEALVNAFDVGAGYPPRFGGKDSLDTLRPIGYSDVFRLNSRGLIKSIPLTLLKRSVVSGGLEALIKDRFKVNGLFTTKGLEKYLREYALSHNQFQQLGVELFVVGTQLNHTRKVIFGNFKEKSKTKTTMYVNDASISDAVAASTSLPPVFAPYGIKNSDGKEMYYFDGEIRDTLSTHVASDHDADLVISSYSVQPYHFNSKIGSLHQFGMPAIINQALYQVIQQKIDRNRAYQSDIKAIYNTIDGYFKQTDLDDAHREKILSIIRNRVKYRPHVDYVYIHPRPQDHEMFFADHFSLNSGILEKIVRIGFKSTLASLRSHGL
jgi:predicted acylesterase/phospholipase RssA